MRQFENLRMRGEYGGMRFRWLLRSVCLVVLLAALACSDGNNSSSSGDQYTCPMHPTVVSATQGACPVCGMDLVRKAREGEELKITEDISRLLRSPGEAVVSEIATVKGTYRKMPVETVAQGVVTYDTRYIHAIPTRIGGRLEKVYVRFALQPVKRGQKIAEIYSPEMLTAQRELLFLAANDKDNELLIKAAREKLYLLGATQTQVDSWLQAGEAQSVFTVYSPYDGYVILPSSDMPPPSVEAPATNEMGESGMPAIAASNGKPGSSATPKLIREGDYVARGQTLFTVASSDAMRVEVSVSPQQDSHIRVGDVAEVDIGSEEHVVARVELVQPFISAGEEFLKIRMFMRGANLQIGQLVRARFKNESTEALWLPREAVYDLGATQIVFVKEKGLFKARVIVTGTRSDGWFEVRRGLASSEEVASSAAYLVDSEDFIKYQQTR